MSAVTLFHLRPVNILIVEDEQLLAGHVCRALTRAGHTVETVADGLLAVDAATVRRFDLLVLDVNLPGCSGFEVLSRLRAAHVSSRVLMLTARSEVGDRVSGLRSGADDYLTKPFALEELIARVEALGRRDGSTGPADFLEASDIRMDVQRRRVLRGGQPVELSPREFEVLHVFMKEPGRTFSRDELCERIWEREHEYDTRTVEVFVMRLRKKLDDGRALPLLETVRGIGYMLRPSA